jgi:type IV fimbrial biogenesis protein FimT
MKTQPRGFTLIEILVVVTMVGILLTFGIPRFRTATSKSSVRSAMSALASMHARAKAIAIQRARTTALVLDASGGTAWIVSSGIGGTVDTVGRVEILVQRFGITFTTTQTAMMFSPRGIGTNNAATTIIITTAGFSDTMTVSAAGRLMQ